MGGSDDLIQMARKRKEPHEIEAIRSVGARTEEVVDEVRRALREWMATPPRAVALEFEAILRVFLAANGTKDDLLQALSVVQ